MNIQVLRSEKNEAELIIDNITVAEILRVYLNKEGADFAAWRREHPSKPAHLKIISKDNSVAKAVGDSISAVKKECSGLRKK